ncbi:MAG: dienelactone hydrolase family protein [Planctomycetes bacterium]|nr:dienelactone hydrolase family protein [Planctomycetota bacterium]
MTRRELLAALAAGALLTRRSRVVAAHVGVDTSSKSPERIEVPWLEEVQTAPDSVPREQDGRLEPLLESAAGTAIDSLEGWKVRRATLRQRWLEFLGPMPTQRPAVELKILSEDRPDGCIRQLVEYDSEPGQRVQGYLLRPAADAPSARRAGIVALHATTRDTIDRIAGKTGSEEQQLGFKLCRLGFVVFCPRCFLWQDADDYREAVATFRRRHPQTLGMHKMLYDAQRAVDVLASLPDVDEKRIGACGHSLGAKETLYLAAFDERVQAAVASEGGLGFSFTNWDAPWYLGEGIHAENFALNHHQLLALTAPRALLILAGESGPGAADGRRTWPFIEAALPVYRLYGERPRLGLYNHGEGHSIPGKAFERMAEWLATYLSAPR